MASTGVKELRLHVACSTKTKRQRQSNVIRTVQGCAPRRSHSKFWTNSIKCGEK